LVNGLNNGIFNDNVHCLVGWHNFYDCRISERNEVLNERHPRYQHHLILLGNDYNVSGNGYGYVF